MRSGRKIIVGIALLLAIHALLLSKSLPSSFFFTAVFCWAWVGVAALLGKLDAIRAMTLTMTALSVVVALVIKVTPVTQENTSAFYMLGIFPSIIAWVCTYIYVVHIQAAEDLSERERDAWLRERQAAKFRRSGELAARELQFFELMTSSALQDNDSPPESYLGRKPPISKIAS